jgi:hypothetical protein
LPIRHLEGVILVSRRWPSLILTIVVASILSASVGQGDEQTRSRIHSAIEVLLRTSTGRTLVSKALKTWSLESPDQLTQVLKPGSTSRTDAVLTRHYSPSTGTESREREVTVYVRQDQSLDNIVLDLAHEMVHATSRPSWDPYDPELTAGVYIKNAIEGAGGEIQAVKTECQVALELAHQYGASMRRCKDYLSSDSKQIDPERIKTDFYKVGKWGEGLSKSLGGDVKMFPKLSTETPRLYSSTGNAPYPAALLQEFQLLTQIACENSKRRVDSSKGRRIASAPERDEHTERDSTSLFLQRRCQ